MNDRFVDSFYLHPSSPDFYTYTDYVFSPKEPENQTNLTALFSSFATGQSKDIAAKKADTQGPLLEELNECLSVNAEQIEKELL